MKRRTFVQAIAAFFATIFGFFKLETLRLGELGGRAVETVRTRAWGPISSFARWRKIEPMVPVDWVMDSGKPIGMVNWGTGAGSTRLVVGGTIEPQPGFAVMTMLRPAVSTTVLRDDIVFEDAMSEALGYRHTASRAPYYTVSDETDEEIEAILRDEIENPDRPPRTFLPISRI